MSASPSKHGIQVLCSVGIAAGIFTGTALLKSFLRGETSAIVQRVKKDFARKLNRPGLEKLDFSEHEIKLFSDVISPDEIEVSFDDIGGMKNVIEALNDNVRLPLRERYPCR